MIGVEDQRHTPMLIDVQTEPSPAEIALPAARARGAGGAGRIARYYAASLLASLGWRTPAEPAPAPSSNEADQANAANAAPEADEADEADAAWARSGAMALTGRPDGPPQLAPCPLASCADGAWLAVQALSPAAIAPLDAAALLGERAAIAGGTRRGRSSVGGSCRLLRALDGWLALNLARADDRSLLPAWLEGAVVCSSDSPWDDIERVVATRSLERLLTRGRLLGLPVAPAPRPAPEPPPWLRVAARGKRAARRGDRLVVDLSSLWAGPLCGALLGPASARVVKLESRDRPDGARNGPRHFFDLLNAGKHSVALELSSARDRTRLASLLRRADVVIESSRPRALAQLGIDAEALVAECPGLTWLSITGYGRREPEANWVAFGDDAAVAAGLAVATGSEEAPIFCGDAIADPLGGLHAALAVTASQRAGGGHLLDLSLRDVTAHVLGFRAGEPEGPRAGADGPRGRERETRVERTHDGTAGATGATGATGWVLVTSSGRQPVSEPRARRPGARARALGADDALLDELAAC